MDNVARVRQASIRVAKVQRRIWLLQTIFLPVVLISGIVTAVAVGSWAWGRRRGPVVTSDVAQLPTNGVSPTPGLNSAPNGNSPV